MPTVVMYVHVLPGEQGCQVIRGELRVSGSAAPVHWNSCAAGAAPAVISTHVLRARAPPQVVADQVPLLRYQAFVATGDRLARSCNCASTTAGRPISFACAGASPARYAVRFLAGGRPRSPVMASRHRRLGLAGKRLRSPSHAAGGRSRRPSVVA